MNMKKREILLYITIVVCFFLFLLIDSIISEGPREWVKVIYSKDTYVNFIFPIYLIGLATRDKYMTVHRLLRIGDRKKYIIFTLCDKVRYAFIFTCLLFIVQNTVYMMLYKEALGLPILTIINIFCKWFLGFVLANIIIEIIKRVENKYASKGAYILVFLIILMDISLITKILFVHFHIRIYLIFSWVFYKGFLRDITSPVLGYLGFLVVGVLLLRYLLKVSIKKDIL